MALSEFMASGLEKEWHILFYEVGGKLISEKRTRLGVRGLGLLPGGSLLNHVTLGTNFNSSRPKFSQLKNEGLTK